MTEIRGETQMHGINKVTLDQTEMVESELGRGDKTNVRRRTGKNTIG